MRRREPIKITRPALLIALALSPVSATAQRIVPVNPNVNPWTGQPHVVTDFRMAPMMSEDMYLQTRGWQSPQRIVLPNHQPEVVQTRRGLPARVANPRTEHNQSTRFYLALSYGAYTSFSGDPMFSNFTDFPTNNNRHGTLGNPMAFSVGLGVESSMGTRLELNVSSVSGMRYAHDGMVAFGQICDASTFWVGPDGEFMICDRNDYIITGGNISAMNFSLGVFQDLSFLFDGALPSTIRPYVGGFAGLSFNSVGDWTVFDHTGIGVTPWLPPLASALPGDGDPIPGDYYGFYFTDGIIQRFGMTTRALSWGLEFGVGINLTQNTVLDFYWRHNDLGRVASGGELLASYSWIETMWPVKDDFGEIVIDDATGRPWCLDPDFAFFPPTGWCELFIGEQVDFEFGATEAGRIAFSEFGIRLRLKF